MIKSPVFKFSYPRRITKHPKEQWFEKIIINNKLLIGEYKNIFMKISMQMKDTTKRKDFDALIKKIGKLKVFTMLKILTAKELNMWLPSMTCDQLVIFCKILSIKQGGKKKEKIDRIVRFIDLEYME